MNKATATFKVTFPSNLEEVAAERFYTSLSGLVRSESPLGTPRLPGLLRRTIVFEVFSEPDELHFLLTVPEQEAERVVRYLDAVIPGMGFEPWLARIPVKWVLVRELVRKQPLDEDGAPVPLDVGRISQLLASTRLINDNEATSSSGCTPRSRAIVIAATQEVKDHLKTKASRHKSVTAYVLSKVCRDDPVLAGLLIAGTKRNRAPGD